VGGGGGEKSAAISPTKLDIGEIVYPARGKDKFPGRGKDDIVSLPRGKEKKWGAPSLFAAAKG